MEIYRQVRVVLVRHLIDIGRLSIQISMRNIHLHGSLCRLPGVRHPLTADMVGAIFSELGKIPGIRRVHGDFDNWRTTDELGLRWTPVATRQLIDAAAADVARGTKPAVYEIDPEEKNQPPSA
jgi:hypothetical protein